MVHKCMLFVAAELQGSDMNRFMSQAIGRGRRVEPPCLI
jgi:hypothetical protein